MTTDAGRGGISIIIRSLNEERHIEKLFRGIREQTVRDVEIILVDSGSTDNTLEIAGRYPVRIVQIRPEDFTFGYSLNRGCEVATGEFIVIASAHVYPVYQDWLELLTGKLADETVGLVYGKQRGNESTRYSERQVFRKWFPEDADYNQQHTFCNNANAAIRRKQWQDCPYDEKLTGLEDIAWAENVHAGGMKIVYEPRAEVIHLHDETYERIFIRYKREAIAMKAIHKHQRFSLLDFMVLCAGNILSDWFHALEEKCMAREWSNIIRFRASQFWGTYRGYNQADDISGELRRKFYYPKSYSFTDRPGREENDRASAIKY